MVVKLLPLASLALAFAPHRNLMNLAINAPPAIFSFESNSNNATNPCEVLSRAFEVASRNTTAGLPIILNVRPSVGTACLKSIPVATAQSSSLLDYLRPYIEYQSTLELLKNPPEEYLLPGVDFIGGMEAMKQKLSGNEYGSQFDVMVDLQSLFVAANDNHFGYTPGLLSGFAYARPDFDFVSLSTDGRKLPEVFAASDVLGSANTTYSPSPIFTIDGQDVYSFLANEALRSPQGAQDPDARLNSFFPSLPGFATGNSGISRFSIFGIPDNYTILHKNGTSRIITNGIVTRPTIDLAGIRSGPDFQQRFEMPSQNQTSTRAQEVNGVPQDNNTQPHAILGYPVASVKHSSGNVATYALNDTSLSDTMVVSFLSFEPMGFQGLPPPDFDLNSFVREFGDVIDRTAKIAREQGRDKLIIDMSANGGGSLDLADFAYTTFFPGAPFDAFDRYRINGGLELTGRFLDYSDSLNILVAPEGLPFGPDNKFISRPESFFESPPIKGQNLTAAFHKDPTSRYFIQPDVFLRGYQPTKEECRSPNTAPWKPENIVILTDGQCASACTIFTGLMVRNFGIRTIALGGRPTNKPMQAIGGVKGSQISTNADTKSLMTNLIKQAQGSEDGQALLQQLGTSVPSVQTPPLLPLLDDPVNGGSVNVRNAYSGRDVDGFPLHFKYEAANCRLFYTRQMAMDVTESWRQAAQIAFRNGTCVSNSTVNSDGRMGIQSLPFDASVRFQGDGIPRPQLQSGGA